MWGFGVLGFGIFLYVFSHLCGAKFTLQLYFPLQSEILHSGDSSQLKPGTSESPITF